MIKTTLAALSRSINFWTSLQLESSLIGRSSIKVTASTSIAHTLKNCIHKALRSSATARVRKFSNPWLHRTGWSPDTQERAVLFLKCSEVNEEENARPQFGSEDLAKMRQEMSMTLFSFAMMAYLHTTLRS